MQKVEKSSRGCALTGTRILDRNNDFHYYNICKKLSYKQQIDALIDNFLNIFQNQLNELLCKFFYLNKIQIITKNIYKMALKDPI